MWENCLAMSYVEYLTVYGVSQLETEHSNHLKLPSVHNLSKKTLDKGITTYQIKKGPVE